MSNYIDLEPQVSDYYGTIPGQERRAGICDALRYLDSHPEQVPGRTITRSKFNSAFTEWFDERDKARIVGIIERLFGITVIPEPTNAQSIDKLLIEFAHLNASCGGEQGDHDLAVFLDARGVKAGGDDE